MDLVNEDADAKRRGLFHTVSIDSAQAPPLASMPWAAAQTCVLPA